MKTQTTSYQVPQYKDNLNFFQNLFPSIRWEEAEPTFDNSETIRGFMSDQGVYIIFSDEIIFVVEDENEDPILYETAKSRSRVVEKLNKYLLSSGLRRFSSNFQKGFANKA